MARPNHSGKQFVIEVLVPRHCACTCKDHHVPSGQWLRSAATAGPKVQRIRGAGGQTQEAVDGVARTQSAAHALHATCAKVFQRDTIFFHM